MSKKDDWWHDLSYNEQKNYLKAHPNTAKHLISHYQKVQYHKKGMEDAKRKIDFLDSQIEKLQKKEKVDPFKLDKLYTKLGTQDKAFEGHRTSLAEYSAKLGGPNTLPEFGDEHLYDNETIDDFYDISNPYKPSGPSTQTSESPENSDNLHPQANEEKPDKVSTIKPIQKIKNLHKKLAGHIIRHFVTKRPNDIVKDAMEMVSNDPASQDALQAAYNHAKKGTPITNADLKKVGKIAAFAILSGAGAVAIGPVGSLYLASHINDEFNHGRGLGPVVIQSLKDIKPEKLDNEDFNRKVVEHMVSHLREELKNAENHEASDRIEHLIEVLEESLAHYGFSHADKATKAVKTSHGGHNKPKVVHMKHKSGRKSHNAGHAPHH